MNKVFMLGIFLCEVSNYLAFSFEKDACSYAEKVKFNQFENDLRSMSLNIDDQQFENFKTNIANSKIKSYLRNSLENYLLIFEALRELSKNGSKNHGRTEDYYLKILDFAAKRKHYNGIGKVTDIEKFVKDYKEKKKLQEEALKNSITQEKSCPVVSSQDEDKTISNVNKDTDLKNDLQNRAAYFS